MGLPEEDAFRMLFAALPTAYLVMDPDLNVVAANDAYLGVVGRERGDVVGRYVFDAFPPTEDALDPSGVSRIQLSFERARDTGRPDTMPIQRYDIPDPATGGWSERFWSLIHVPVLGEDGKTVLLVQRTEDITEFMRERSRAEAAQERGAAWQRRVEDAEADLFARAKELSAAREAEAVATRRLAALADVSLQLAQAQTVENLTAIILHRGVAALGAVGGAVAVRGDDDDLHLTITSSLPARARAVYAELPLQGPLPVSLVAAHGHRVLLPDAQTASSTHPEMSAVMTDTGCVAWAFLPLKTNGRLLGSLVVGWTEPQTFGPAETEVLDALAAQCSYGLERIQSRLAEQESAAAARRMSETLQRSLLTDPPRLPGLEIAVRYRPAAQEAQVGGDWYDAFSNADGSVSLVIGDVAGHDRDAAAAMGQLRNLLRGVAYIVGEPPGAVLSALDRALRDLEVDSLATAVLADLDRSLPAGMVQLRWSNAGHPPPLLIRRDGTARLLTTEPDLLLGLDATTVRGHHEMVLEPGDTLLLYTDGLVERRDASLDAGLEWLAGAVEGTAHGTLDALCDGLLDAVDSRGDDDVALLALRVVG